MESTIQEVNVNELIINGFRVEQDLEPLAHRIAAVGWKNDENNLPAAVANTQNANGSLTPYTRKGVDMLLQMIGSRRATIAQSFATKGIETPLIDWDKVKDEEVRKRMEENILLFQDKPFISCRVYNALTKSEQQEMLADDIGKKLHGEKELVKFLASQLVFFPEKTENQLREETQTKGRASIIAAKAVNKYPEIRKAFYGSTKEKPFTLTHCKTVYNAANKGEDIEQAIAKAQLPKNPPPQDTRLELSAMKNQHKGLFTEPLIKATIAHCGGFASDEEKALLAEHMPAQGTETE